MSDAMLTQLALESDPGLSAFFLGRLSAMVDRQLTTVATAERKALGEAIFSVYLDCLDLGLETEARAIVGQLRDEALPEQVAA